MPKAMYQARGGRSASTMRDTLSVILRERIVAEGRRNEAG